MDIKETVEQVISKVKSDKDLQKKFMTDPKGAIESISGIDIPDDQIDKVIDAVSKNVKNEAVSGVLDKVKDLF